MKCRGIWPLSSVLAYGCFLSGCAILSGPTVIDVYRVTEANVGAITSDIEGRKDLAIQYPGVRRLVMAAIPSARSEAHGTSVVVRVTLDEGTTIQLKTETLRAKACEAHQWTTYAFTRLTGGGSTMSLPVLTKLTANSRTRPEGNTLAGYALAADLPLRPQCLRLDFPHLLINDREVPLGQVELRLAEIQLWAPGH